MSEETLDSRRLRRDHVLSQAANLGFAVSQSMTAVVVPLLAVEVGHPVTIVGIIVAVSAVAQTIARLGMGAMMSRIPTKHFILTATVLLATSCFVLGISGALWAFVVSQLLQGAARAYFWTGSQTHVVRASDSAVSALSKLNVMQGVGQLIGPALAGTVGAWSLQVSLFTAGGLAMAATLPAMMLIRFEPFSRRSKGADGYRRRIWLRPGVGTAASMTAVAGAWRGILNSYLPVILTGAGYSVATAGALVTVTNFASLGGSAFAGWAQARGERFANVAGTLCTGVGLALVAFFPSVIVVTVLGLLVSGWGAGWLQTIGPALAADSVGEEERGRAIASIGIFRSVSLLISPLAAAGLVLVLPGPAVASGIAGIIISVPALVAFRKRNSSQPSQEGENDDNTDEFKS